MPYRSFKKEVLHTDYRNLRPTFSNKEKNKQTKQKQQHAKTKQTKNYISTKYH